MSENHNRRRSLIKHWRIRRFTGWCDEVSTHDWASDVGAGEVEFGEGMMGFPPTLNPPYGLTNGGMSEAKGGIEVWREAINRANLIVQ